MEASHPVKVLIVNHEPLVWDLFRAIFFERDWQLFFAADSKDALEMAWNHQPPLVFIDVTVPDGLAWIAIDRIKHHQRTSHAKVVVLMSIEQELQKTKVQRLDVDALMFKPFNLRQVRELSESLLQKDGMPGSPIASLR
ncbi:MAG: response regulator [SAR202 cluster bacterium]|nr:response regulator [SAR202 cluster bacterium]